MAPSALACGCVGLRVGALRVGQLFEEMARSNATMDAPEFLCMIQELLPRVSRRLTRSLLFCLLLTRSGGWWRCIRYVFVSVTTVGVLRS